MGYLSRFDDTDTLTIPGGFWIRYRTHLNSAELGEAEKKLYGRQEVRGSDGKTTMLTQIDQGAQRREKAVKAIVEWNLTDRDDQVLPLAPLSRKREMVGLLDDWIVKKIADAVDANQEMGEQEAESFPEDGEGVSADEEPATWEPESDGTTTGADAVLA